MFTKAVYKEEH